MQISTLFGYVFVELWVVIALGSPLGTFDRHGGVIGLGGILLERDVHQRCCRQSLSHQSLSHALDNRQENKPLNRNVSHGGPAGF